MNGYFKYKGGSVKLLIVFVVVFVCLVIYIFLMCILSTVFDMDLLVDNYIFNINSLFHCLQLDLNLIARNKTAINIQRNCHKFPLGYPLII